MNREENRRQLIRFLETICRPDMPLEQLDDNDALIGSGLIDSLAILEIITFLETAFNLNFSTRGVDPDELASITSILDLIEGEIT